MRCSSFTASLRMFSMVAFCGVQRRSSQFFWREEQGALVRRLFRLSLFASFYLAAGTSSFAQGLTCANTNLIGTTQCLVSTINSLTGQIVAGTPLQPQNALDLIQLTHTALSLPFVNRRNDFLLASTDPLGAELELLATGGGLDLVESTDSAYHLLGSPARTSSKVAPIGLWSEGALGFYDESPTAFDTKGRMGLVYVGANYRATPGVLLGALLQLDDAKQTTDSVAGRVSERGWMLGPYAVVRLSDNIFLQGRAAWGRSSNEIDLANVYSEDFEADRWLVRGTLLGRWYLGQLKVLPHISVGYVRENQEAHITSLGIAAPSESAALGQAKFGPEINYQYRLPNGLLLIPSASIEGIWNFDRDTSALVLIGDETLLGQEFRGRAEIGLGLFSVAGSSVAGSVYYDGIGDQDFHSIGGKVTLTTPLDWAD
jgi:hypothetical protein